MIAGLSIGSDARRYFHFSLPRLAIVTVILMPLLYGALYLWTFWNPFGEVDKIPVAIVNVDKGITLAGESLDAGAQVSKQLIESGQLDLTQVKTEKAAMADLESGKYYFVIVIPEDFSAAVASPTGEQPRQAKMTFYFNDANSYLSTIIGQDAAAQVINQVNAAIAKQSLGEVLTAVKGSEPVLDEVDSGADDLAKGLDDAKVAAGKLSTGSKELTEPLKTAAANTAALDAKVNDLVAKVDDVTTKLQAKVGANPVPGQITGINAEVTAQLNDAVAKLQAIDLPAAQDVAAELQAASGRLNEVNASLSGLVDQGDADAIAAIGEVRAQADALRQDIATLDEGVNQLAGGSEELVDGAAEFAAIIEELSAGAEKLDKGFTTVLGKVPNWTEAQRDGVATALSSPVLLKEKTLNEADTFGTGFAPFFMSLSLFVGGIIVWMILTPLRARPVEAGVGLARAVFTSYWPALVVGFIQATILYGVVLVIGLRPTHVVGMWLFAVLASATFIAMIQAFNAIFGEAVGRVVTLAFLMLQLVSSGGIYPVQTTAGPIQALHIFDPMTYTVNGYRQLSVAVSVDSRLWVAIAVLVGILLVSLAASTLSAWRNRVYTMDRLYPMVVV
jgi:putative membrane protein